MEKSDWSKSIPLKEQFQIVKRMFYYAKPYKKQFFIAIFWGACLAVINVMLPKILQVFMDDYLTTKTATSQVILTFAALYFGVTLVKIVVWFLQMYLYQMATEKTVQNIRNQLFEKLHTLGMRYFDQTPAGSIVSRVTNDTETIKDFWGVYLTVLQGLFAIVSAFTAMFLLNRTIALWCLLFLPVLLVIVWYYQRFSSKVYRGMREKLSQLNTKLNESISGMSIIQQFRQEKRLQKEFNETNESYYRSRVAMVKTNALLLGPIINLLYTFSLAVVLGFFGYDALKEPVSVGVIYAFISYVQSFFNPMTNMMDNLSIFQDGMVSSGRVLRIMDNQELSPAQREQADDNIQDAKIEF